MTCPCGCQREVKPGNTYASQGCFGRAHKAEMARRSRLGSSAQWGGRQRRSEDWRAGFRAGLLVMQRRQAAAGGGE